MGPSGTPTIGSSPLPVSVMVLMHAPITLVFIGGSDRVKCRSRETGKWEDVLFMGSRGRISSLMTASRRSRQDLLVYGILVLDHRRAAGSQASQSHRPTSMGSTGLWSRRPTKSWPRMADGPVGSAGPSRNGPRLLELVRFEPTARRPACSGWAQCFLLWGCKGRRIYGRSGHGPPLGCSVCPVGRGAFLEWGPF